MGMGMGTFRYPQSEGQAATYWRRRFLALVGGLAVLALIAWAFSGALGGGAAHTAGGDAQAGQAAHQAGQGGGSGQGAAPASSAQPSAAASAADPAAADPAASASAAGSPAPRSSVSPAASGAGQPRRCHRSDVVLSLSASQDSFSSRQPPVFDVDIVSTSASPCTFNVGAKHVTLVISAGRVRIWGSADCIDGQGSLITDLQRGIPTVLPISWNRQTSSPGCEIASAQVPAGTYSAIALDGPDVSNSVTFRLS